jgi:hypothetical protein
MPPSGAEPRRDMNKNSFRSSVAFRFAFNLNGYEYDRLAIEQEIKHWP